MLFYCVQDEDSPPSSQTKDKLETLKEMETKREREEQTTTGSDGLGGKNGIKLEIKSEIKQEPMETDNRDDAMIKEEPRTPSSSLDGSEVKSVVKIEPIASTNADKKPKCLFKTDELRQALKTTLEKLYRQDPESIPFRNKVDPELLGIPNYFDIIKNPMDLSKIKSKLDGGEYSDPWEYVDDVWLMFDNAWLFNRKTSRVYRYCTKVSRRMLECFYLIFPIPVLSRGGKRHKLIGIVPRSVNRRLPILRLCAGLLNLKFKYKKNR